MPRTEQNLTMLDIRDPHGVDIEISKDEKTLWVNVDGICRLRVTFRHSPSRILVGDNFIEAVTREEP